MLSEMVYVYLKDGLKFVTKLMKRSSSISEHEPSPAMSSIYCLHNNGVECLY